jgi:hypothetical protein
MGSNGQQLSIFLPNGSTKVQVAGTNQNNDHVIWQGVAYAWIIQNPQNVYIAATYNWWWKGAAEVWFDDFTGRTFILLHRLFRYLSHTIQFFVSVPELTRDLLKVRLVARGTS